ncbi:DinB family protein [Aquimarina brevivitae]|uniref:Putative damage-inducible protein DinB n=1 Tax=Aquimarina brevivitae TaxID=323412 RepID=A0A4Q7P1T3_9FLAO|nr:DinB family protein [Aquimarina brevivitae]RZS93684.1 putative damage-inducible protein DinB [Aquimarina brevivitae]
MTLKPNEKEYDSYYQHYINLVEDANITKGLQLGKQRFIDFVVQIPNEKFHFSYAEGKWTIAEVLLHLIDTERVFSYRAFRIGRGDTTPLPGFQHDEYVPYSNAKSYTKQELLQEFTAVRESTLSLFNRFNNDALKLMGVASGAGISVRAIGYIIAGHQAHHLSVIQDRYL